MSEGKIIVGLDIGTTKIACIVGRKGANGKIEILGYGKAASTGVSRGIVTNIDETVNAIKAAVQEASDQSNVDIKAVNVGIAGQHIKSLQHRGVMMRDDRNKEVSDEELEKLRLDTWKINMSPGEVIFRLGLPGGCVDELDALVILETCTVDVPGDEDVRYGIHHKVILPLGRQSGFLAVHRGEVPHGDHLLHHLYGMVVCELLYA